MIHRALAMFLVLSIGCAYVPSTRLEYEPATTHSGPRLPYRVAVVPLEEDRPPRYWPSFQGRAFLSYIPLVPFFKVPYERVDESYLKAHDHPDPWEEDEEHFTRKAAQAIAHDLDRSQIFQEVRFVESAEAWPEADLVLGGKLRGSEYDVYITSYMLGMAGVLLWIIPGVPVGRSAASMDLDLELRTTSGDRVWSEHAEGRAGKIFWLYTSNAKVGSQYGLEVYRYKRNRYEIDRNSLWAYHSEALRRAMEEAKASIVEGLAAAPLITTR